MTTHSRLVTGTVAHRRHRPTQNAFRYRVWHLLLDVDHLDEAASGVAGLRIGRRGPVGFRRQDHFGDVDLPLRQKVAGWVEGRGATLPDGPLLVYAHPRVLGHVFNPVSWWFAHDRDGSLRMVIAEVRNTFGDWHAYLLDDLTRDGQVVRAEHDKDFHVSPFLPVEGLTYRFTIRPPVVQDREGSIAVSMDVEDADGTVLQATQAGRLQPLTTRSLWVAMARFPLVTIWTVVRIHAQAVRLLWRRTPFHRRPEPPPTGLEPTSPPDRADHLSEQPASTTAGRGPAPHASAGSHAHQSQEAVT